MHTHSPKILIVDDTPTNVELIDGILSAEGFSTFCAADAVTAVALTRAEQPDLILLDVIMPGESGFDACLRLKADPATAGIPVIFLSALDDVKSRVAGLKAGGVDFISKPVHAEEVLARVRVHLRISESNRNLIQQTRMRLEQLRDAQLAILVKAEDHPECNFSVYYEPLEEAGGDFYDVFPIDANVSAYFVGDISGHGVSAAFPTSAIKVALRQYATPLFSPEDTLRNIDSLLRQIFGEEQFMTASYAKLNRRNGVLSIVSAGNPPLIMVTRDGAPRIFQIDGEPLGMFNSSVLQRKDLPVFPGDRLFLYSDGLIEASPGGGRESGLQQLVAACVRQHSQPLSCVPELIARELRPDKRVVTDDLLLMAVEV